MAERDELYAALADCLAALEAGASLENALARYPALDAELRPLLATAQATGAGARAVRVPTGDQVASRSQFLNHARELAASGRHFEVAPVAGSSWWTRWQAWLGARRPASFTPVARALMTGAVILAGVSIGTYGTVAASATSLPGDPLYGVKRSLESAELILAPNDQSRAELQAEIERQRVREIQTLASQHRPAAVEFTGTLISMSGAQNQYWLVSGVLIVVGPQVPVAGAVALGTRVQVRAAVQADGQVLAQQVTVLPHQAAAPEPSATVTATASQIPAPTATPALATPSDTETPRPTSTLAPTLTPTSSPTREPGGSPPPSETPEPTASVAHPAASSTARPTQRAGEGQTQTAEPTGTGDYSQTTQTPQATEGGDHGGATQTPQATEGGDHPGQGDTSPSKTPASNDG